MKPSAQPAGNYYDKYRTRNPIARALMRGFLNSFDRLAVRAGASNALEIGCGEGELSIRLARQGCKVRACDIEPEVVPEARGRAAAAGVVVDFFIQRIEEMRDTEPAELVVCCEVLEHLDDPNGGLEILARLAKPWLLCSVPREPLWRVMNMARGRYLAQGGNTPGHVNHWSRPAFLRFLSQRFEIVEVASPLPWTMTLCRRT